MDITTLKEWVYYRENPIEFIENFVKIPLAGGDELLKLYDEQKEIVRSIYEDHYLIVLKSRQIGISTVFQAICAHICTFYENCVIGMISRDGPESSDFCRKVQNMIDKLPKKFRPTYINKPTQYFILKNGNQFFTSPVSPSNPSAVFRGKSLSLLLIDEAAHINHIDQAWTALAPALSKAHMDCERKNIPFGTAIFSTPNKTQGTGEFYYKHWIGALNEQNGFIPHRVHWKQIPIFANDPNWYRKQCQLLDNDANKIAQELELQFVGSENTLFDQDIQMELQGIKNKDQEIFDLDPKNKLHVFEKFDKKKFYLIGVDIAGEFGEDFSTVQVMNFLTCDQVAEFKGKLEITDFSKVVKKIANIYPKNLIIVENTGGYGTTILEDLRNDEKLSYSIFGENRSISTNRNSSRRRSSSQTRFIPGLNTNAKTRPLIIEALYSYVRQDPTIIKSERLALELANLSSSTKRIEAAPGYHDDLAFAFAFCCYVRKYHEDFISSEMYSTSDKYNVIELGNLSKEVALMNGVDPLQHMYGKAEYEEEFYEQLEKQMNNPSKPIPDITKFIRRS